MLCYETYVMQLELWSNIGHTLSRYYTRIATEILNKKN